jgi:predicted nucleic acid-binding protein
MIAVDTNLLIFAHRRDAPDHKAAMEALSPVFEGMSAWALPWPCLHEFIGIVTRPGIYKPASTLSEAFGFVDALFASPQLHLLARSLALNHCCNSKGGVTQGEAGKGSG